MCHMRRRIHVSYDAERQCLHQNLPCGPVQGLGLRFRVQGLGIRFRFQGFGLRFRVQGLGFSSQGVGFRCQGLGFRVQGLGFRVQVLGCRLQVLGYRLQVFGGSVPITIQKKKQIQEKKLNGDRAQALGLRRQCPHQNLRCTQVYGLGFRVQGLGFRVQAVLGFRLQVLGGSVRTRIWVYFLVLFFYFIFHLGFGKSQTHHVLTCGIFFPPLLVYIYLPGLQRELDPPGSHKHLRRRIHVSYEEEDTCVTYLGFSESWTHQVLTSSGQTTNRPAPHLRRNK